MSITMGPNLGQIISGEPSEEHYLDLLRFFRAVDGLVMPTVSAIGVNSPSMGLTNGLIVIVGSAPTGAFTGHANKIARYRIDTNVGDGWEFFVPKRGWSVNLSSGTNGSKVVTYVFNGSAWIIQNQEFLVSGENIKSINNQSLLGSGNIVIPEGTVTGVTVSVPIGLTATVSNPSEAGIVAVQLTYGAGYTSYTTDEKTKLASLQNYVLEQATVTALGGVKLVTNTVQSVAASAVTATASRTYSVQLNSDDQMVVNVPWVNTTYTTITVSELNTGTATTARAVSAQVLESWITGKAYATTASLGSAAFESKDTFVKAADLGVSVATLELGKIPLHQLPATAITDTFPVSNQTEMLALVAERGDVAVRLDLNKSFILRVEPASVLGNWQELLTPEITNTNQIPEGAANLYFTTARARASISTSVTGLTYSSSTGVLALSAGYSIPTTAKQTNWDTVYGWGNHSTQGYLKSADFKTVNGTSLVGSGNIVTPDTITRIRGTTSGTYTAGDITILAGTNTSVSQTGGNITISSTDTTYATNTSEQLITGTDNVGKLQTALALNTWLSSKNFLAAGNVSSDDIVNATTVGRAHLTLANTNAIRYSRINADNSVSLLTDVAFRTALGLGTGATATINTSVTDSNTGRLLRNGDWGGTGGVAGASPPGSDLNNCVHTGFYSADSGIANRPGNNGNYIIAHYARTASNFVQIAYGRTSSSKRFFRFCADGVWEDWLENWDSGNLLNIGLTAESAQAALNLGTGALLSVTSSTTDSTANRLLRTADGGWLGNAPATTNVATIGAGRFFSVANGATNNPSSTNFALGINIVNDMNSTGLRSAGIIINDIGDTYSYRNNNNTFTSRKLLDSVTLDSFNTWRGQNDVIRQPGQVIRAYSTPTGGHVNSSVITNAPDMPGGLNWDANTNGVYRERLGSGSSGGYNIHGYAITHGDVNLLMAFDSRKASGVFGHPTGGFVSDTRSVNFEKLYVNGVKLVPTESWNDNTEGRVLLSRNTGGAYGLGALVSSSAPADTVSRSGWIISDQTSADTTLNETGVVVLTSIRSSNTGFQLYCTAGGSVGNNIMRLRARRTSGTGHDWGPSVEFWTSWNLVKTTAGNDATEGSVPVIRQNGGIHGLGGITSDFNGNSGFDRTGFFLVTSGTAGLPTLNYYAFQNTRVIGGQTGQLLISATTTINTLDSIIMRNRTSAGAWNSTRVYHDTALSAHVNSFLQATSAANSLSAVGAANINTANTFAATQTMPTLITNVSATGYDVDGTASSGNGIPVGYALLDASSWTNTPLTGMTIATFKLSNIRTFQLGVHGSTTRLFARALHTTNSNGWVEMAGLSNVNVFTAMSNFSAGLGVNTTSLNGYSLRVNGTANVTGDFLSNGTIAANGNIESTAGNIRGQDVQSKTGFVGISPASVLWGKLRWTNVDTWQLENTAGNNGGLSGTANSVTLSQSTVNINGSTINIRGPTNVSAPITSTAPITAPIFYGVGASLTDLNASNITNGIINSDRLPWEKGTFTPSVAGDTTAGTVTYTASRSGRYLKIGKMVHGVLTIGWTAHSGTGTLIITGLPFVSVNTPTQATPVTLGIANGFTCAAGEQRTGHLIGNSNRIEIIKLGVNGNFNRLSVTPTGEYLIYFQYEAA